MGINFGAETFFYIAQTGVECRQLFFELNYLALREAFLHGTLLLITGLIFRI